MKKCVESYKIFLHRLVHLIIVHNAKRAFPFDLGEPDTDRCAELYGKPLKVGTMGHNMNLLDTINLPLANEGYAKRSQRA